MTDLMLDLKVSHQSNKIHNQSSTDRHSLLIAH